VAGFIGANVAGDAFTEQTFEEIGLGNDCQLVDDGGKVTFDSPECVAALDFYGQLQQNYSVTGAQDVDTTRAAYFAGKGAMLIWSSFVLDEMAGLRKDALPTCPPVHVRPRVPGQEQRRGDLDRGTLRLGPGHVRRDHLVDHPVRLGDRLGQEVRQLHDDRRLPAVDQDRARGQDPGPHR
jgi:hypothetical protein